jgi:hypothetical protein
MVGTTATAQENNNGDGLNTSKAMARMPCC